MKEPSFLPLASRALSTFSSFPHSILFLSHKKLDTGVKPLLALLTRRVIVDTSGASISTTRINRKSKAAEHHRCHI